MEEKVLNCVVFKMQIYFLSPNMNKKIIHESKNRYIETISKYINDNDTVYSTLFFLHISNRKIGTFRTKIKVMETTKGSST